MLDKRKIKLIVAMSSNSVIGNNNDLPWKGNKDYKWDMNHFKFETINKNVVMGYNTYLSLNSKGLKDRNNYLISRNHHSDNIKTFDSIDSFMEFWKANDNKEDLYIIGGAQLYKSFLSLDLVDELILPSLFSTRRPNNQAPFLFLSPLTHR